MNVISLFNVVIIQDMSSDTIINLVYSKLPSMHVDNRYQEETHEYQALKH